MDHVSASGLELRLQSILMHMCFYGISSICLLILAQRHVAQSVFVVPENNAIVRSFVTW